MRIEELKNPDCVNCEPSKLDPRAIPPKYRDHARALLLSLGQDPSPSNVSKLEYKGLLLGGVHIPVELREYIVYSEDELVIMIEQLLLTHPLALPARLLAILITHSVSIELVENDFRHIIQIAENFRQNPTPDSIFTLRAMIDLDPYLEDHLREVLIQDFESKLEALQAVTSVYSFTDIKEQVYNNKIFYIFEYNPFDCNSPIDLINVELTE